MEKKSDIIIIGGGPAGYVAAIRAAQLNLSVVLIEREHLGGICLNWGCIPTKALLNISEILHTCKVASKFGLKIKEVDFDLAEMIKYSRSVTSKLTHGIAQLMKKHKITVVEGEASLDSANHVKVKSKDGKEETVSAKHIIIATGARPREIEALKVDGEFIWNYKHALSPTKLPKKLLIVGSGAIGSEFASFYNILSSEVTLMEMAPRILPNEDEEVSNYMQASFTKRGIKILTGAQLISSVVVDGKIKVKYKTNTEQEEVFDVVIAAVGIVPNIESLKLSNTKVTLEKGFIKTNEYLQTNEKNIYAIGDVTSPPWLAHKASHEAIVCIENIAGKSPHPVKKENIPACTYTYPQIASIGITEEAARKNNLNVKIGRFPLQANGKALAVDEAEGFVKTIFDTKTGELLGAHMVGHNVTEIICGLVMAKNLEATEEEIINTIFPHPTISESIHESVLDAFGKVIHK